jgi:hypothetical protein
MAINPPKIAAKPAQEIHFGMFVRISYFQNDATSEVWQGD